MKSQRGDLDPAGQLPANRYLAVTTLQDDGAEGNAADDLNVSPDLETEPS